MSRFLFCLFLLLAMPIQGLLRPAAAQNELSWPPLTSQTRPWAFNWWLGSAVDKENLTKELQRYHDGGLGGIHIIPIYGAKGAEARYLNYLSPQWMAMLDCAVTEAKKRDMGVDMTLGTGWCFGGPSVTSEQAGMGITTLNMDFPADSVLPAKQRPKNGRWQFLSALGPNGERVDLRDKINPLGTIAWHMPGNGWKLAGVSTWPTGIRIKRAAPGGSGFMINPIYGDALRDYLKPFDTAFANYHGALPRSTYQDSYEYANAAWSPDLPEEFAKRNGYHLEEHWAELAGSGDADKTARVWHDYRKTVSDLMVEKVFPQWTQWSRAHGMSTRYQAHGAPANWLDLYALADVPETEMFGNARADKKISRFDAEFSKEREPLISKFASSAAHVTGKPLVSSETGTWLAEHFCETFEEMKCLVDLLFASGVNHVFYHGCVYSPDDAAWPGWLFYAATEMNPRNPLWREAPALNNYIARTQSILQAGTPDNDVLLYWPSDDVFTNARPGVQMLTVHNSGWLNDTPCGQLAKTLFERGYNFDFISDRQIATLTGKDKNILAPGGTYRTLLVPACKTIPPTTLRALLDLARGGATVCFAALPEDGPGLANLEKNRAELKELLAPLQNKTEVALGAGRILIGNGEAILQSAGAVRESVADHAGVIVLRRRHANGRHYFIANQSQKLLDGWFALGTPARSVVALDALTGQSGVLASRTSAKGATEVNLRLEPGHSIILRTFENQVVQGPAWHWMTPGEVATNLGRWHVEFIEGGPQLPKVWDTAPLGSWTKNGDQATEFFSGTARYTTHFDAPQNRDFVLDLGEVAHTARVRLNGNVVGTLFMHPYRLALPAALKDKDNLLEVEVTNLGANRLRYLDRNKIEWRKFNDANVVAIGYGGQVDATNWPVFDSGLIGPVTLRR